MNKFRKKEKPLRKRWRADEKKACAAICGGFFILVFSTFLGEWKRGNKLEHSFQIEVNQQTEKIKSIRLSESQKKFLAALKEKVEQKTLHQAANVLEEEWEKLEEVFAGMPEDFILYIGREGIADSLEGMGLAVRRDKTCFYGNFQEGKPEGVCTAIYWKNKLNYQYSMGIWKNGQMEGQGMTGSVYPREETSPKGRQIAEEQVSGIFFADKLDGAFIYQQTNQQGEDRWWKMTAHDGRTCLDKRWRFKEEIAEYGLLSEKDERAVFVVPKNEMHKVWWKNRVPWKNSP